MKERPCYYQYFGQVESMNPTIYVRIWLILFSSTLRSSTCFLNIFQITEVYTRDSDPIYIFRTSLVHLGASEDGSNLKWCFFGWIECTKWTELNRKKWTRSGPVYQSSTDHYYSQKFSPPLTSFFYASVLCSSVQVIQYCLFKSLVLGSNPEKVFSYLLLVTFMGLRIHLCALSISLSLLKKIPLRRQMGERKAVY